MHSPFPPTNPCYLRLLPESYDPNGKHMEYYDSQGKLFARIAKAHKTGNAFMHLFDVFQPAKDVYAELRATDNTLLMTTTAYRGENKHDCRVEIHAPDGTLFGVLRDASYGADFHLPDETVIGGARRPSDRPTEPMEVVHTYTDAAGRTVGTCDRRYPDQDHSLLDFLVHDGVNTSGMPVQTVTLEPDIDPTLRTFLLLFPALQHLRYSRSG